MQEDPNRRKYPSAFRPRDLFDQWDGLRKDYRGFCSHERKAADILRGDAPAFLIRICKLRPFWYQLELAKLYKESQFLAVRWPRQTGKSTTIAALLVQDAYEHDNTHIGFIGPSWRQTKQNITRAASFCLNLPDGSCRVQKTRINFSNGSVIEAFPNNPETIRGNTFNGIYWDEAGFTPNDIELYDSILFTLGTTNGKLIVSSTPFSTDSLFFHMCKDEEYADFVRHHFSYERALEPNGPLKPEMIERLKRQFGHDEARWRREMEAEWAEDEDVWLPTSLSVSCLGTVLNCGMDLEEYDPEASYCGKFFVGVDLGQTQDYSSVCVCELADEVIFLRHLKLFPHPTMHAHVLGYLKMLQDRWGGFEKIRVDNTREGPSLISDMENAGINNVEGVCFSLPRKSEMATLLRERMRCKRFFFPFLRWEKPYRNDICTELNVERFQLRKDGNIAFSHPCGTHDDVFWSIALSVYGTVEMFPETFLTVIRR